MINFPCYNISLAGDIQFNLIATDDSAAAMLSSFAAITQLGPGSRVSPLVVVTSKLQDPESLHRCDISYQVHPLINGGVNFRDYYGLTDVLLRQLENSILFHGALAVYRNMGVIMVAKGGTGKSTASNRLSLPWRSLSDDLSLVIRDHQGVYWAHPWPTWSRFMVRNDPSARWNVQEKVLLKRFYHLLRAREDRLATLGKGNASIRLMQSAEQAFIYSSQAYSSDQAQANRLKRLELVLILVNSIPIKELSLSLHGSFWSLLEDDLENLN